MWPGLGDEAGEPRRWGCESAVTPADTIVVSKSYKIRVVGALMRLMILRFSLGKESMIEIRYGCRITMIILST